MHQIDKFLKGQEKASKNSIRDIKANKIILSNQHDSKVNGLNDDISDFEDALEDAKRQITPEQVASNSMCKEFAEGYWHRINIARNELDAAKQKLIDLKDEYELSIKDADEQINRYEDRIEIVK